MQRCVGAGSFISERDLHLTPLVAVAAGRQPRTRCWIRLCVIELSHAANHHCASRTKQGRFCSVFLNLANRPNPPNLARRDIGRRFPRRCMVLE